MTTRIRQTTPLRPDVEKPRPSPSTAGYWTGAILALVGFAVVGAIAVGAMVRMNDRINAFPRMSVPGVMTVRLEGSTGRTLYIEGIAPMPLAAFDLHITDPNGGDIAVRAYGFDTRYDVPGSGGTIGNAVGTFVSTVSGPYRIEVTGAAPPGTTLAVGDSVVRSVIGYVLAVVAVLLGTIGAALALIIVTAVRRSKARNA